MIPWSSKITLTLQKIMMSLLERFGKQPFSRLFHPTRLSSPRPGRLRHGHPLLRVKSKRGTEEFQGARRCLGTGTDFLHHPKKKWENMNTKRFLYDLNDKSNIKICLHCPKVHKSWSFGLQGMEKSPKTTGPQCQSTSSSSTKGQGRVYP